VSDVKINPYASPMYSNDQWPPAVDDALVNAIFRKNKLLVMNKRARLPDRCVKTNLPTTRRLKRNLAWHHPAIYFTILISLWPYD
jgi:hypothetical protein